MDTPTIESLSTTVGQVGQWVYLSGTNFIQEQTKVFFGSIECVNVSFYSDSSLGVLIPEGSANTASFRVETPSGAFTSEIVFEVKTIVGVPTVTSFYSASDSNSWVYVQGTNFVTNQTQIEYNNKITDVFVYGPDFCGFAKETEAEIVDSIKLITPNGSTSFPS